MALKDYLGEQFLGILASYQGRGIVHHIGVVYLRRNDQIRFFIPRGHALAMDSLVTLHLDNRTGVDELDAELRVYRASYKGRIVHIDENWITVDPLECQLVHGLKLIEDIRAPGYEYPEDTRAAQALPLATLSAMAPPEEKDHENKVGVLTTLTPEQPHTTVLAFLTSEDDDVFLIIEPGTFKLSVLARDPRCFFVIDERAKFTFDEAIHWNYTIMESVAHEIPKGTPLYEQVRTAFIIKNPWEAGFFMLDGLTMLHLPRKAVVMAGEPRPLP
ncbi:hypothetical protein [Comamonas sp. NLF-1-9]|uniref:hypothetical protein n=1 Tax=Comamonas sp. NLF-1-9 TaxID=2853163 RepID=UPI001C45B1C6|nr:hypothetical protein [Comamonas sp. NLF-1-9]QXL84498.1 hypothetical protein KUD94_00410 [Comamonas sp. NLF-1-9]